VFSPDILGRNALVELMENLMNNRRSEAIGIATSGRNTPLPELGFQFTLSKTRDSVGYASAAPQSYSILRMRLDIRPLDIGQSLGTQRRPRRRRPHRHAAADGLSGCPRCVRRVPRPAPRSRPPCASTISTAATR
jgi:hypothetical protein